MPYIAVESGSMDPEVKRALIEGLTRVAAETMRIPAVRSSSSKDPTAGRRRTRTLA
jgi:hypothetical protein